MAKIRSAAKRALAAGLFREVLAPKHRTLFLPRFLAASAVAPRWETSERAAAHAIVIDWAKLADTAALGHKETALDADFLEKIFWQRRIRANDTGEKATPYWFPAQTGSGSLREDRLVLPIPPGTHWRDVMPIVLPGMTVEPAPPEPKTLPGGAPIRPRPEQPKWSAAQKAAIQRSHSRHLAGVPLGKKAVITAGGIKYVERTDYVPDTDAPEGLEPAKPKRAAAAGGAKPRAKNDPKLVAAARELRDRWMEQVNEGRYLPAATGKYDVSRAPGGEVESKPLPLLKAG